MYSSEQNNADVQFNAGDSYGDEKGFINDIKTRKSQLFTANSYDGQAYRSLVAATKSIQPLIFRQMTQCLQVAEMK